MKTNVIALFFKLAVILFFISCSTTLSAEYKYLTGGEPVSTDRFQYIVKLGDCNASKIGDYYFLTSSRCANKINNSDMNHVPFFHPNEGKDNVKVVSTIIHCSYTDLLNSTGGVADYSEDSFSISDVAIAIIEEDTPNIPLANINYDHLGRGSSVILTGYGSCGDNSERGNILKIHPTSIEEEIGNYYRTKGTEEDNGEVSICMEDRGAPLVLDDGFENSIVGINSMVSDSNPVTNYHTAISDNSLNEVGGWLKAVLEGRINSGECTPSEAPAVEEPSTDSNNSDEVSIDLEGTANNNQPTSDGCYGLIKTGDDFSALMFFILFVGLLFKRIRFFTKLEN